MTDPAELYLDLLKSTLTGMVYEDPPIPAPWLGHDDYRMQTRVEGYDWPQHAPCMIGLERLGNVKNCVQKVIEDKIPGDLAEAGVWRGGTCIWMRALLKLAGISNRNVWVIDSFAGLPRDDAAQAGWDTPVMTALAVSLEEVKQNFMRYGMLDDQVRFLPGWFRGTLPDNPVSALAVLRADADLYESQLAVLEYLYPKLSPGGFFIADDSHLPECAQAVREYREKYRISEPVQEAGKYAIWWRKES